MQKKMTAKKARPRIVPRENQPAIAIKNKTHRHGDIYVRLLAASWGKIFVSLALSYLGINLIFALLYLAIGNGIENARPGSFADAFFFSVQTLATIGYGRMVPEGLAANLVVTAETLAGFTFFAIVTGLVFSKFSRPTARVMFSKFGTITLQNGVPQLMVRMANERSNSIVDARIDLTLLRLEPSAAGGVSRRFYDLTLVRARAPLMRLTFTAMHPIDEKSPLFGMTQEMLERAGAEIIVSLNGLDETMAQPIHARYSYLPDEIHFNAAFEDVVLHQPDGSIQVDYTKFHDVRKLDLAS